MAVSIGTHFRLHRLPSRRYLPAGSGWTPLPEKMDRKGRAIFHLLQPYILPKLNDTEKSLRLEDYDELRRAVGLAAHEIGIGAFVYLRRIFERLIAEAHQIARQDSAWDEDCFLQSRMPEKIRASRFASPCLSCRKQMASHLGEGLHPLSEGECLQYFSITQHGIELILERENRDEEKNEKIKQATKDIALLSQKIKEQGT